MGFTCLGKTRTPPAKLGVAFGSPGSHLPPRQEAEMRGQRGPATQGVAREEHPAAALRHRLSKSRSLAGSRRKSMQNWHARGKLSVWFRCGARYGLVCIYIYIYATPPPLKYSGFWPELRFFGQTGGDKFLATLK